MKRTVEVPEGSIVVVLPHTEALICCDTLRKQRTVFADVDNTFAANACALLAERLYEAMHPAPPTRYERIANGDSEP